MLTIAFLAQYASVIGMLPRWNLEIWLPVFAIGWPASFYMGWKQDKPGDKNNPAIMAYASSWLAIGVSISIFFFVSIIAGAIT